MGILLSIILGLIAGWIASAITRSPNGFWMDMILGVLGAIVGGFVMTFFGQPGVTDFNLYSLVVAVFGAVLLIWVGRLVSHGTRGTTY